MCGYAQVSSARARLQLGQSEPCGRYAQVSSTRAWLQLGYVAATPRFGLITPCGSYAQVDSSRAGFSGSYLSTVATTQGWFYLSWVVVGPT